MQKPIAFSEIPKSTDPLQADRDQGDAKMAMREEAVRAENPMQQRRNAKIMDLMARDLFGARGRGARRRTWHQSPEQTDARRVPSLNASPQDLRSVIPGRRWHGAIARSQAGRPELFHQGAGVGDSQRGRQADGALQELSRADSHGSVSAMRLLYACQDSPAGSPVSAAKVVIGILAA